MRSSRFIYITCVGLAVAFLSILLLSASQGNLKHPEQLLKGTWKEVSWTYDKVDGEVGHSITLSEEVKDQISQDLFIHASETWLFEDNSEMILRKRNMQDKHIKWRLKGRGHILKLHYPNEKKEYYQIRKLTSDKLVIHFENDTHARGIVKIVLKKIKD